MPTIYVPLQNEGTDVWRPVEAHHVGGNVYQLPATGPPEEEWRFSAGSFIRCKRNHFADGTVGLVAYALAPTVPTASQRSRRLEGEIGAFVRQYARKHYPSMDPNDRRYDREIEQVVRRMSAEELDALMHGGASGEDPSEH